jgi:hypothetical protein
MTRFQPLSLPARAGDPRRGRRVRLDSLEQFETRVVPTTAGITLVSVQTVGEHEILTLSNSNPSNSSARITVADYSYTDLFGLNQTYAGSKTFELKGGQTKTVSIDLACNASNQLDILINEDPITNFNGVPDYFLDPHLLDNRGIFTGFVPCTDNDQSKVHGNEGLGNGVDPPPPGHAGDAQQNDDPGHGPGDPNQGFNKS